jgi:hypothetical protein
MPHKNLIPALLLPPVVKGEPGRSNGQAHRVPLRGQRGKNRPKALILTSLAAGLLSTVPLSADDMAGPKPLFGIEAFFAMPAGNTHKVASNGFGAGVFLDGKWDSVTKRGNERRESFGFSINYVSLGEKKWERDFTPGAEVATSVENINIQINAGWTLFFSGESGLYLIGGIGCGYATIANSSGANSRSFVGIGTVGFEYAFNRNISLIARYTGTGIRGNGLNKKLLRGRNLEYLQFGAQYRF